MTTALYDAMQSLLALKDQELTDLIDLIDMSFGVPQSRLNSRRSKEGRPAMFEIKGSSRLKLAIQKGSPDLLNEAERRKVRQAAKRLKRYLKENEMEDEEASDTYGSLLAKFIRKPAIDSSGPSTGRRANGPYLYQRTWRIKITDEGEIVRALRNIYIGHKQLAKLLTSLPEKSLQRRELSQRILKAWRSDSLDVLEAELLGIEN